MKLFVQYHQRRSEPFHPTLKINVGSGYCRNQWTEQHFREGVFTGAGCVANISVEAAVKIYFSELKRMGYTAATVSVTPVSL